MLSLAFAASEAIDTVPTDPDDNRVPRMRRQRQLADYRDGR